MNEVRLKPSYVATFRVMAIFVTIAFILTGIQIYSDASNRTRFVDRYFEQNCSISQMRASNGKNATYTFELSCDRSPTFRETSVSRDRYDGSFEGQKLKLYVSEENHEVWEFFRPTASWNLEKSSGQWTVWGAIAAVTIAIFAAIWKSGLEEMEFLREATFVDAEVTDTHREVVGKSTVLILHVKYLLSDGWVESTVGAPNSVFGLSQSFKERTIRLVVDKNVPKYCRVYESLPYSQLVPKS